MAVGGSLISNVGPRNGAGHRGTRQSESDGVAFVVGDDVASHKFAIVRRSDRKGGFGHDSRRKIVDGGFGRTVEMFRIYGRNLRPSEKFVNFWFFFIVWLFQCAQKNFLFIRSFYSVLCLFFF